MMADCDTGRSGPVPLGIRRFLAILAAVALLVPGCASKSLLPVFRSAAPDSDELIRRLQSQDGLIQTMQTVGTLKWNREGDKGSVDHALLIHRPGSLRLEALSPLGPAVFSLVIRRGEVELFAPSDGRTYRGAATVKLLERLFALPMAPADALSVICGQVPLCPAERTTVKRDGGLWILDVDCRGGGLQQRIRVDPAHGDPVGLNLFDPSGQVILSIVWAGHKKVGAARLPMEIQVEMPQKGNRLDLRFKDPEVNVPIPEDRFRITIPQGISVEPLS
jgi:outer membrane lipoprotein-sorting protein